MWRNIMGGQLGGKSPQSDFGRDASHTRVAVNVDKTVAASARGSVEAQQGTIRLLQLIQSKPVAGH